MITTNSNGNDTPITGILTDDQVFLQELVQTTVQAVLEAEMTDHLGAAKSERTAARKSYRSGSYARKLYMKVGTLELRVPQSRDGTFSTRVFERYRRSEKALASTLIELYVNGNSANMLSVARSANWRNASVGAGSRQGRSRTWSRRWIRT